MAYVIKRKGFKLLFRFDRGNPHWTDNPTANIDFIESEITNLNYILRTSGRLSVGTIYEALGIDVLPCYRESEFMYRKDRYEQLMLSSIVGYTDSMWVYLVFSSDTAFLKTSNNCEESEEL